MRLRGGETTELDDYSFSILTPGTALFSGTVSL